ncbi:enoyl-CoA hydratase [Rhodococcus sp. BP-349]|uniref:MaoC/PaaZ C-terminal domain-containing protein n=1 Tax=unclassified Rhodococcus (in: high G+C Gram-positive bacteria) TaxID=192944 RepID=UPI001C9B158D|nr:MULTISPECIES: MaoC/PaaZ C-terminal domain-containing protein [unclassified Rhodococcus (in: high G+C Gram-positive bacteria)]MBY6538829.1 enoyl-CoA hydratase [Rhodococcus sp. BP-363]MBY6543166.1 enoyl-CoA hydratase [Rhodococcus sp. BP-369]MBY6562396.1 enoyl-CoA hydratase [Rhodococcus sp. BP-370]MBY6576688.1 enoyl-CoA hydratase [Rhodococcus sp. BP-364]MBY6585989.1 enoyl-CoA hydratase [Rhodococcus sp. BP-358]
MRVQDLPGRELGQCTRSYTEYDAALYALAVGAGADRLDLVYERDLSPLPTFAAALGLWATEAVASECGYAPTSVLHIGQTLHLHMPLEPAATVEMTAHVTDVHDKGHAALIDIRVSSFHFDSGYLMYVRGEGGWGGARGPSARPDTDRPRPPEVARVDIDSRAAALYRLTGDLQPVHIDPVAAVAAGMSGPIVHGLCTLGTIVRATAEAFGHAAVDVTDVDMRLLAPVYPSTTVVLSAEERTPGVIDVVASVADTAVASGRMTVGAAHGPQS